MHSSVTVDVATRVRSSVAMIDTLAQWIAKIGIALLSSVSPHHTPATLCAEHAGIQFCYYAGAQDNRQIIYFMHGFGNDVTAWTWNPVNGRIDQQWASSHTPRPTIVTLSKNVWWYTDAMQGAALTEFVHWFEGRYLAFTPGERVLYGDSMGAHNAYRWTQDETSLFTRLALTCPAIPSYFVPQAQWVPPHGVYEPLANLLIASEYAPSAHPDYNPLLMASQKPLGRLHDIHIIVSTRDDFGFYAGGRALYNLLRQNPYLHVTYEEQAINHCDPRQTFLARFLVGEI